MAMKSRCWSPCVSCKAYGNRCSQSRPCKRCVKSGRQCKNLEVALSETDPRQTAAIGAERPMRFHPRLSIGDETMPLIQLPSELHWVSVDLMKNMAVGHDVEALTQFFTTLNLSDSYALYHAVSHAASIGSLLAPPPPQQSHMPHERGQQTMLTSKTTWKPTVPNRHSGTWKQASPPFEPCSIPCPAASARSIPCPAAGAPSSPTRGRRASTACTPRSSRCESERAQLHAPADSRRTKPPPSRRKL
jgi:hypothetical protein